MGVLGNQIPDRIARIRHCRNRYVEELRRLNILADVDYVFVADLDGMNSKVSRAGVRSSFSREGWSVVLANQLGGYYDLLALRHATWCPTDILRELRSEQDMIEKSNLSRFSIMKRGKRRLEFDRARKKVIYSKMRMISTSSDWIDVDSGFGGLGIYRSEVFADFDYTLKAEDAVYESEHVALSNRIVQSGGKIFINPRMINNFFNTYNINRIFAIRQIREIYWNSLKWLKPLFKRS